VRQYFPPVDSHLLQSKYVAQQYQIRVAKPPQKRGESRRLPVLYLTDANDVFDEFCSIAWRLQLFGRDVAPFLLVGIGYPGDSPLAGMALRARDLTFSNRDEVEFKDFLDSLSSEWEDILLPQPGTADFNGAEAFQNFMAEELIPFIDQNYATEAGLRTFFGHSLAAGFGLFTLLTRPALFRNYIVSSPTVDLELARHFLASGPLLDGTRLFLSVGTEEQFEPLIARWQFVSNFYQLVQLLKEAPPLGLEIRAEALAGETHATAWPIAFMHGLRWLLNVGR